MSKGAKFRLKPSISKPKLWGFIDEAMLKLKKKLAKKCKIEEVCFEMWLDVLKKKIKRRHQSLKQYHLESNDIFEQEDVKMYLKKLHDRFVIVPVDKASNNYAIICKTFYIKVLMNEMGVIDKDNISGNTVYQQVHLNRNKKI